MPQLNPDPWFLTLFSTWLTYIILQPKILSYLRTNTPNKNNKNKIINTKPWTWPWT
uniref:ATP synthase complex subunit 8 n=1 Tax=Malacochersus tornieri TaxID=286009 RepID=Q2QGA6_9SAUR|nr:ATP synthase F0 subunit 8 [Malacochersus tornieri]AAY62515.1 ATP synthase F0 subunit 8 [Malacochersus tornieri]